MANSLFDKNFRYTEEASELSRETNSALRDIFAVYVARGYSPREIAHVMHGDITDLELNFVLDWV